MLSAATSWCKELTWLSNCATHRPFWLDSPRSKFNPSNEFDSELTFTDDVTDRCRSTRSRTDANDFPLQTETEKKKAEIFSVLLAQTVWQMVADWGLTRWALNQYLPLQKFAMPWTRCGMQWRTNGTFGWWCIRHMLWIDIRLVFVVLTNWWQHQRWPDVRFSLCDMMINKEKYVWSQFHDGN